MNLADYDQNQPKKPPPVPGDQMGAPTLGANPLQVGAQPREMPPPPALAPAPKVASTLAGSSPTTGDVKPGPTYAPPTQVEMPSAAPAAPPPAAAAPPTPVDHRDPSWAAKGVDFNKIESGAPVPGQPGATFVHNGQGWTIQQGAAPAAGSPAAAPAPGTPAAAPGTTPTGQPTNVPDAFKQALLGMLNGNQQPPSINDPALKAQSDAFAVGQTRASERERSALAERRAADGGSGVNSGSFDTELSGIHERQGERQGGFNAGLVGDELKARRQQLMQAATLAGNQLNAEDARKLQSELAQLDAQIRREGIAQQGALGHGDLDLRGRLGEGQLNLGLLQSLLQNNQFGRAQDQQGAQFGAGLDQQGILGLLGLL